MAPHTQGMTVVAGQARLNTRVRVVYGGETLSEHATLERALETAPPAGARVLDAAGKVRARLEHRFDAGRTAVAWKVVL